MDRISCPQCDQSFIASPEESNRCPHCGGRVYQAASDVGPPARRRPSVAARIVVGLVLLGGCGLFSKWAYDGLTGRNVPRITVSHCVGGRLVQRQLSRDEEREAAYVFGADQDYKEAREEEAQQKLLGMVYAVLAAVCLIAGVGFFASARRHAQEAAWQATVDDVLRDGKPEG